MRIDENRLLRIEAATIIARALAGHREVPADDLAKYITEAARALEPYLRGPGYAVTECCLTCEAAKAADARAKVTRMNTGVDPGGVVRIHLADR